MALKYLADLMIPLYDEPGDGGGGGTTGTPAPGGDGAPNPESKVPQNDPANASKPGAAPAKPAEDDKTRGILADLQKERRARQQFEGQVRELNASLDAERRRVQALAGVSPQSDEEKEADAVRQRFKVLYPHLADLTAEDIKAIREMRESAASIQETTNHHWQLHGRQMLDAVTDAIGKEMGGTLSERQMARIKRAYVQEAEADPQFLARHEAGDKTLITEFTKTFLEDFFEPARRKITQTELDRARRVPSGRDRSLATQGAKKVNYSDPKAVEDAMVASFREHGGDFGD